MVWNRRACLLEIRYDRTTNVANYRAVIGTDSLPAIRSALDTLVGPSAPDAATQGPNGGTHRQGRAPAGAPPPFPSGACPRQDSNLRTRLRRPVLYPLSYEGGIFRLPAGQEAESRV